MTAGITPMRTSLKLNWTSSLVITISAAPTNPKPPAKAAPLIAAITGFGLSIIAFNTSGYGTARLLPSDNCPGGLFRSAPAQKAGPDPVMTMDRTASSSFDAFRWSKSSVTRTADKAFLFSGRFRVIQAAPFLIS